MKAVIRPDMREFAQRIGLDAPDLDRLIVIERIAVDVGTGAIEIHVELAAGSSKEMLDAVRASIVDKSDGAVLRVVFRPKYREPIGADAFLQRHWQDICADIEALSTSLRGSLEPCRWIVADGSVEIQVGNAMCVDRLSASNVGALVGRWLQHGLGSEPTVRFVAGEFGEEIKAIMQQRQDEARAKAQEQAEAAAVLRKKIVYDTGKAAVREPMAIKSIASRPALNSAVTFEGTVFGFSPAPGEQMPFDKFNVTDYTSSLECVAHTRGNNGARKSIELADGDWIRVSGTLTKSQKEELEVKVDKVERIVRTVREETSETHRVELHAHTKMSQSDGVTDAVELIKRAALWRHPAIGITDHGNVHIFPEAYAAAKKAGIKLLLGMEGYVANHRSEAVRSVVTRREEGGHGLSREEMSEFKREVFHIVLYVRNRTGLRNLYELVTKSHIQYFYNKPLMPRDVLLAHREGLVIGSACESGEIFRLVLAEHRGQITTDAFAAKLAEAAAMYDYFEIQPRANNMFMVARGMVKSEEDLRAINRRICDLGAQLGKPVVATGDVHVLDEHDMLLRRVLQVGQGFDKETDESGDVPVFFKTTDEMLEEFSYLGPDLAQQVVITNPALIAGLIEHVQPIPDGFHPPTIEGSTEELTRLCQTRCRELYGPVPHPFVLRRMERELNDIVSHHFADLYMLAQKVVRKSLDDGYIVGSRGSVGSSFVAYLSGITEVNSLPPHYVCPKCFRTDFVGFDEKGERRVKPLDGIQGEVGVDLPPRMCHGCGGDMKRYGFDIPFETFVGYKGDKTPDIDLNFASEYQPRAHRFVEELFGKEHVYRAGTIATIKSNTGFGFVKKYLEAAGEQWTKAEIDRVATGLSGVKRTTGQHPGGVIILPHDKAITEFCPAHYPANRSDSPQTTHFDYHAMEEQLLKLDVLGHEDPTQIKMLSEYTGKDITNAPLDDPQTLALFSGVKSLGVTEKAIGTRVGTFGVPEFGTEFVRGMLDETRPKTFADLVRISGLSHGTDVWLNNARDLIRNGKATLKDAICTRDDIMHDLIVKGVEPFTAFKIMEKVRKGKGLEPADVEVMKKQNVPEWYIESCQRIKYMFPKAHAVAYVINAMRIAYCKVHHPAAFYASYFTIMRQALDVNTIAKGRNAIKARMDELLKEGRRKLKPSEENTLVVLELALEMVERNIVMRPIDIHASHATRCLIEKNEIIPPLTAFPGLGDSVAESIVAARQDKLFTDREDLRIRTQMNKTVIEKMVQEGILAGMPESAQHDLQFDVMPAVKAAAPAQPAAKKKAAKKQEPATPDDAAASLF